MAEQSFVDVAAVLVYVRKSDFYQVKTFCSLAAADEWASLRGWQRESLPQGWRYIDGHTRVMATAEYEELVPIKW